MNVSYPQPRLHGLDALRAFALLLGIVLHASMSFMPNAQFFWLVHDVNRSDLASAFFYTIHVFRMPLFFLLAGFFAQKMLEQRGVQTFVKNRLKRIVLPLIIFWPLIFGLLVAAIIYAAWVRHNGSFPKTPNGGPKFTADDFPLMHMWFLYVLTLLYGIYLIGYCIIRKIKFGVNDVLVQYLQPFLHRFATFLCGWCGPFVLALPVSFALFYTPYWVAWFGVPTPDRSLYPAMAAWVGFGVAFLFGCILASVDEVLNIWAKRWKIFGLVGVGLLALNLQRLGIAPNFMPAPHNWNKWLDAWLNASAAWSICFALIGLVMHVASKENKRIRYLADASYWVYLIHLPIVVALQAAVSKLELPALLKFLLVIILCSSFAVLSYHFLIRYSIIGTMLNGKRIKTPEPQSDLNNDPR